MRSIAVRSLIAILIGMSAGQALPRSAAAAEVVRDAGGMIWPQVDFCENGSVVLCTDAGAFFVSDDRGITWQSMPNPACGPYWRSYFDFISRRSGGIADGEGIWETTDGGRTWQCTQMPRWNMPGHFSYWSSTDAVAMNADGIWFKSDGQWIPDPVVTATNGYFSRSGAIINGRLWCVMTRRFGFEWGGEILSISPAGDFRSSVVRPDVLSTCMDIAGRDSSVAVLFEKDVLYSANGGMTWMEVSLESVARMAMSIAMVDERHILVLAEPRQKDIQSALFTLDVTSGQLEEIATWSEDYLTQIRFLDSGVGFVVGKGNKFYRSTDQGRTWTQSAPILSAGENYEESWNPPGEDFGSFENSVGEDR